MFSSGPSSPHRPFGPRKIYQRIAGPRDQRFDELPPKEVRETAPLAIAVPRKLRIELRLRQTSNIRFPPEQGRRVPVHNRPDIVLVKHPPQPLPRPRPKPPHITIHLHHHTTNPHQVLRWGQQHSFFQMPSYVSVRSGMWIVRDHHNGFMKILIQTFQNFEDFGGGMAIEIARRLVRQQ